jgi:hypothetical protein
MADEKQYLDVVGFIEQGREKKRKPVTIGYAYRNNKGDLSIQLQSIPVGGSWDGSLVVQPRREREQGAGNGYGTSGYGANAKHTGSPDDDSGMPF